MSNRSFSADRLIAALGGAALEPETRARLALFAELAAGAYAPSTLALLDRVAQRFASHTARLGCPPLPADPTIVVRFVEALAADYKPASIRSMLGGLSMLYRGAGFEGATNPVTAQPVKLARRRAERERGTRQRRARALAPAEIAALKAACPETPAGKRDRALLTLTSACLLRRSELVALDCRDILFEPDGSAALFIAQAKGDPTGDGVYLPLDADEARDVHIYLEAAGLRGADPEGDGASAGPLLWPVSRAGRPVDRRLSVHSVTPLVRTAARRAGLPAAVVQALTSHSPRRGTATAMLDAGLSTAAIQQAGRWASGGDMISRYTSDRVAAHAAPESRRALRTERRAARV